MSTEKLTNKDADWFLEVLSDPVVWAETFLRDPNDPNKTLELRSYQKEPLSETLNYKYQVLRYGRRMGKSVIMCVDALYWATAKPLYDMFLSGNKKQKGIKILILTPMESQIKMLFDTLIALSQDSPFIQDMITKIKRSDVNEIHFSNGTVIKGMTIGISSGNKGTGVRGMSADYMLLDELDFIPKAIFEESVLPISNTNKDCKIRGCSTPSGKREYFFKVCTGSPENGWYHKHAPSWHPDNPSWVSIEQAKAQGIPINQSTEYQYKSVMSNEAYNREFGAEFGEELSGVYKHGFINKSLINYGLDIDISDVDNFNPGFKQNPENYYIIGVDWNTYKNGGQIVLLEYCASTTIHTFFDYDKQEETSIDFTNKFRLFYRAGIKYKEATQQKTREKIIELCRDLKIDYIYVDYGAGDTNIEELTTFGKKNPTYKFNEKLKVIDSGANVEHYDPILQKKVKKRAKSMMVNISAVSLEEGKMLLPKEDDRDHGLIHQMRGYVVKNVTHRGDFTYEGEDHVLDAFNLAVYGFYTEFSNILKSSYENKVKFMNNPMYNNPNSPVNNDDKSSILFNKTNTKKQGFNVPRFKRVGNLGRSGRRHF